jgi:predicted DNA-binding transcriptional regulator AlpA
MSLEETIKSTIREILKQELARFIPNTPQALEQIKKFISIEQVMELTQMTKQGIFKRIREGKLKAFKPGRRLVFEEQDVIQFIQKYQKKNGKNR